MRPDEKLVELETKISGFEQFWAAGHSWQQAQGKIRQMYDCEECLTEIFEIGTKEETRGALDMYERLNRLFTQDLYVIHLTPMAGRANPVVDREYQNDP